MLINNAGIMRPKPYPPQEKAKTNLLIGAPLEDTRIKVNAAREAVRLALIGDDGPTAPSRTGTASFRREVVPF